MTNKVWDDFQWSLQHVFATITELKSNAVTDDWKKITNKTLLDELKVATKRRKRKKIENIKTSWNNIGKVQEI